mmetsp:Transcript_78496/g.219597  ORF Transcript_78496/g.219597 Transcript_78496/m.219597 type:complete len:109 (-) Transcript_78496:666-992(-)
MGKSSRSDRRSAARSDFPPTSSAARRSASRSLEPRRPCRKHVANDKDEPDVAVAKQLETISGSLASMHQMMLQNHQDVTSLRQSVQGSLARCGQLADQVALLGQDVRR